MAFILKITTTGSPQTFTIPCRNVGTFNATIDWGDGGPTSSITAYNDADLAHSYTTAGQYTITITGTFPNIYFNNCLLYTSPSPRDRTRSRMPSSA